MGKFVTALVVVLFLTSCDRWKLLTEGDQSTYHAPQAKEEKINILLAGQSNMERLGKYASAQLKESLYDKTGKEANLIPCAVGGTWSGQWLPGAGNLENCIELCKGKEITAIFYWQGESDAYNQITYWDTNFKQTVEGFQAGLGNKDIRIVFAQIARATGDWLRGWKEVQKDQASTCLPNVKMIKTKDLVHVNQLEDEVHVSACDLQDIAKRFVEQL